MISDMFCIFSGKEAPQYEKDTMPSFAINVFRRAPKGEPLTISQLVRVVNKEVDKDSLSYTNKATITSAIPFLVQAGLVTVEMGVFSVGVMGNLVLSTEG